MTAGERQDAHAGDEPDPRFSLANQRTFLAWIRTALALVAAGLGLTALLPPVQRQWLVDGLAVVLVLAGSAISVTSYGLWQRNEEALRHGTPLPRPALAPVLAYGVAVVAVATLLALLLTT